MGLARVIVANRGEIASRIIRACNALGFETILTVSELMSRSLLNIAKRSLLRLMLSCVGLASKHAAG